MSIFIDGIPIIEQAGDIDHRQAALIKINFGNQCCHERHEPGAGSRLDLQHILSGQVQHRAHHADLDAIRRRRSSGWTVAIKIVPRTASAAARSTTSANFTRSRPE
jgi:hypothetical protein